MDEVEAAPIQPNDPHRETGLTEQERLIRALLDAGRYPHPVQSVQLIETHISWVLLAGVYAYKIKKAVHLDFLDFTEIEARMFYCLEEIRLNRRLAPEIYLEVVPIGGSFENPRLGRLPAIEYAVKMIRFPPEKTLDKLAQEGGILPGHVDFLAEKIAAFHQNLPPAGIDSGFGRGLREVVRKSFLELRKSGCAALPDLEGRIETEYAACGNWFEERLKAGHVRECHGDLHLGNIALFKEEPVPFDCIEFDPKLRWIDVMNEIAFPVMDLLHRDLGALAYRFLNAYLQCTGDYPGLKGLRYYLSCRAVVRGMVDAVRASQSGTASDSCRKHLLLADRILSERNPFLIITHGLPGSGKTTFSQFAAERLEAIRIRSDVERKRIAGLSALESSRSGIGSGIYSQKASGEVYSRLLELSRGLLLAGFPVVVDAAFLETRKRLEFLELAKTLSVPFAIASMQADRATLESRILARKMDASEADLDVLDAKVAACEPLRTGELDRTARFSDAMDSGGWDRILQLVEIKKTLC